MTFFVCFNLLLRFLVIEIEYYILYSDSNNDLDKIKKDLAELGQQLSEQNKKRKESIDKWFEDQGIKPRPLSEILKEKMQHSGELSEKRPQEVAEGSENKRRETEAKDSLNKVDKNIKQDSSDVVNDGAEPTPLTDLDGGDG